MFNVMENCELPESKKKRNVNIPKAQLVPYTSLVPIPFYE